MTTLVNLVDFGKELNKIIAKYGLPDNNFYLNFRLHDFDLDEITWQHYLRGESLQAVKIEYFDLDELVAEIVALLREGGLQITQ
jgi:hypothetical protein